MDTVQTAPVQYEGRPSRFGMICAQLAGYGTKDAMPGLAEALAKDVFFPPTTLAPYRLPWLAALSIASRDPWPGVDDWLAERIASHTSLNESRPATFKAGATPQPKGIDNPKNILGPELGATAAAMLLTRHGRMASEYGLLPVADPLLKKRRLNGYRFEDEASRNKVQQWWKETKKPTELKKT
jgi:hypothetical protein